MKWVIPGVLARAQRPGYRGELRHHVPMSAVNSWIDDAREEGIKSIICLLAPDELAFYEVDLVAHYRDAGFAVDHIPVDDYQRPPLSREQLECVSASFHRVTKPVLIHCSAGFGRSRMAIEYICSAPR